MSTKPSIPESPIAPGLLAVSEYIPRKEALLLRVDMSDYLIDYYLHRKEHAPDTLPEHDQKLKDLIACFAVHLGARTARETHAWTVHIADPEPYSLFVTGSTGDMDDAGVAKGFLVGHVLTDNIRATTSNAIHAQFTNRGRSYRSMVQCESSDIRQMVEHFYDQSEQYPLRLELSSTSDTAVGLVALPEYDEEWMRSVSLSEVQTSPLIERSLMRTCAFEFACDCSPRKLIPFLQSMTPQEVSDLYGFDQRLEITCPRCAKRFFISREDLNFEH